MMTEDPASGNESFQPITLPNENEPRSKLRLFVTIVMTVFIFVLVLFDQFIGLWSLGTYWVLFTTGLIGCCLFIWVLLRWNEGHRKEGEETFLEKWGDEIGWPLMILAFTIQLLIPQIRPVLLGAILGGSWLLVIWTKRKESS
jgi:hypothetical protein